MPSPLPSPLRFGSTRPLPRRRRVISSSCPIKGNKPQRSGAMRSQFTEDC